MVFFSWKSSLLKLRVLGWKSQKYFDIALKPGTHSLKRKEFQKRQFDGNIILMTLNFKLGIVNLNSQFQKTPIYKIAKADAFQVPGI